MYMTTGIDFTLNQCASMLLNFSNHPLDHWSETQIAEAKRLWGTVRDLSFPVVPPDEDHHAILLLAERCLHSILAILEQESDLPSAVHIMGEQTLCFPIINALQRRGIACLASTTHRRSETEEDRKISYFQFVRFREYPDGTL